MTSFSSRPSDFVRKADPRDLIREAYRIDGITSSDCRTIFLDWSLGDIGGLSPKEAITGLLACYGADAPDHPMTHVLRAGLEPPPKPRRRGGYKARPRD
ncbi:hypothetical protein [Tropicimonas sp. S265A]|uniref:hypothetical protein n=1 Tax=Tropicimonas sp. S265A TaxID=3415134 RepID=UPI003C7BC399